jgi:hypothetical protein
MAVDSVITQSDGVKKGCEAIWSGSPRTAFETMPAARTALITAGTLIDLPTLFADLAG